MTHSTFRLAACWMLCCVASGAVPAWSEEADAATSAGFVDEFDHFDSRRWYVSDGWTNGDHQNCTWSRQQIRLNDGVLSLGFARQPYKERSYSCAEIQTNARFGFGVYEARLKADGAFPGLNAAFFSFIGPVHKQPHDEIDFEILLKDPARVQLNTFVDAKSAGGWTVDVPGGADKAFHDYAFVWEPDRLRWYVDGMVVKTVTDRGVIPDHPQKIFVTLWGSDTLSGWMGEFTDPGRPLRLLVDRVAFTPLGQPCRFSGSLACEIEP